MNRRTFWMTVATASARARGNRVRFLAALEDDLSQLTRAELIAFQRELDACMDDALTWELWGAAYLLDDGCSDDGFAYFRALLIANGEAVFEAAVKDPDSLASLKLKYGSESGNELEEMLAVPGRAYARAGFGTGLPRGMLRRKPAGKRWSDDDLPGMLPRLAKKVGARRRRECPLEPGQVFRIPLPNSPGAFAHFKVIDKRAFPDFGRCVTVRLLDWWSCPAPENWEEVVGRSLRSADPYKVNVWDEAAAVFTWDEPGWSRDSVQVVGSAGVSRIEKAMAKAAGRFDHLWPELALDAEGSRELDTWPTIPEIEADIRGIPTSELEPRTIELSRRYRGIARRHRVFVAMAFRAAQVDGDFARSLAIARIGETAAAGCWGARAQQVRALHALKRFEEAEQALAAYRELVPRALLRRTPKAVEAFVEKMWG